jgi:uncharacterized protein (DUF2147 family)
MTRVICVIVSFLALIAFFPATAANATSNPIGLWLVQDGSARVRIFACGEALCGNVVWLSQPTDAETGQPQKDKLNIDPQLRARPILGVSVVLGMQRIGEDNKWTGRLYNPDDGNTYRGTIELLDPTHLKVQGCVTVYCQVEIWTRVN